ncbi:hypothetical protein [Mycobacteroides chelonae]|uniref:hypothetical protein n=1 Tax=Mycobacteroides chelonae TaxID=1774 RepID=UPI000991B733|nr:hypothetical protein [Mycobacteroides chelonae]
MIAKVFRWMLALSPEDRVSCVRDLAAAAPRGELRQELRSWRETARCTALGLGRDEVEWLGPADDDVVERP